MFKKTVLLVFVAVAAPLVLRQFDVKTGISAVDRRVAILYASLHFDRQAPRTEAGSNDTDREPLDAVYALVGEGIGRLESGLDFRAGTALALTHNPPLHRDESFAVHIAAFSDSANAERLAARLQAYNFDAGTYPRQGGLYAVRIGPFGERSMADEVTLAVQEATIGLTPLVVSADSSDEP